MKKMNFTAAMKDFFGYKHGQTMAQFFAEVKALNPIEKNWFKVNLASVGYEVTDNLTADKAQVAA